MSSYQMSFLHFKSDFTLSQGFMLALGTRLWLSIEHAVGSSLVTMFKMTMYPLSLCPTVTAYNYLQFTNHNFRE
jgi:hypothetical protein